MPANYVLLGEVTLGASAASVTFSNIPQTGYTDLKVVCSVRSTDSVNSSDNIVLNFNGSTANFSGRALYGTGSAAASLTRAATSTVTWIDVATDTANTFASVEFYIPNYTSANYKSVSSESVQEGNIAAEIAAMGAILWSNTAAITSIALTSANAYSFDQYSTFYLYGIAAVGTTPVIAPFASGGDVITNDGTYWIHTFLSSGTFTPAKNLTCDTLVVAGAGGGGRGASSSRGGGGGGAGGYRTASGFSVTSGSTITVTVGAGGAGGVVSPASQPANGNNSVFSTITSTAGGRAGYAQTADSLQNGAAGGSGGGSTGDNTAPGTWTGGAGNLGGYSPVEGYAGGSNVATSTGGGGGGGATATGNDGTNPSGGAGGAGASNSISGSAVTYATGGNGGNNTGSTSGTNGTANTGNGGNGGKGGASTNGGNGGSGIVIVRYPMV
jgi:hypothetical protein